jgi:maltooligosyltrehalose trehalohydrolase
VGLLIQEGRKREFMQRGAVMHAGDLEKMPNPQAPATFTSAKLKWEEVHQGEHGEVLALYRAGLKLRREIFPEGSPKRDTWTVELKDDGALLSFKLKNRTVCVALHIKDVGKPQVETHQVLLRSSAPEFCGSRRGGDQETIVYVA